MPTTIRRAALLAALATLAVAAPATAATLEKTIEGTYSLDHGGSVRVENVNGTIAVTSWDRDDVRVVAHKKVRAATSERAAGAMEDLKVLVSAEPDELRVRTRHPRSGDGGFLGWLRGAEVSSSVSYELTVPRGVHLDAETVNGRLDLDRVDGDFTLTTVNGAIRVSGARGRLDAGTVNGAIDVELVEVDPDAELDFSTTNGAVRIALPQDVRTRLDVRTTNGGIDIDFPVEVRGTWGRHRVNADINGGGGVVSVRTTNGGVRIRRL
jgi:DUF4097 and DUF4098 domain-containing protein YvlB